MFNSDTFKAKHKAHSPTVTHWEAQLDWNKSGTAMSAFTQISKAAELTWDLSINISVSMVEQAYYPVWEALAGPETGLEHD